MAPPTYAEEPGAGGSDRGWTGWGIRWSADPPTVEPHRRRRLIEPHRRCRTRPLLPVLARVEKHVRQRAPHFPRSPQHAHVVAPEEDRASPSEYAMDAARDARCDRLHAAAERLLAGRLDHQVYVIALNGELRDAEVAALAARAEAAAQRLHEGLPSE